MNWHVLAMDVHKREERMNIKASKVMNSLDLDYGGQYKNEISKGEFDETFSSILSKSKEEANLESSDDSQLQSQLMMGQVILQPLLLNEPMAKSIDLEIATDVEWTLENIKGLVGSTDLTGLEGLKTLTPEMIVNQEFKGVELNIVNQEFSGGQFNEFIDTAVNEIVVENSQLTEQINIKSLIENKGINGQRIEPEQFNFSPIDDLENVSNQVESDPLYLQSDLEMNASISSRIREVGNTNFHSGNSSEQENWMTETSKLDKVVNKDSTEAVIPNQGLLIGSDNEKLQSEQSSKTQLMNHSKWENRDQIVLGLKHQISILNNNETKVLNLKLYPQHLGSISVELKMKNGILNAHVSVEQIEMKPILEQVLHEINLAGTGIEQLNVEVSPQNQGQNPFNQQKKLNQHHSEEELLDIQEEQLIYQEVKHVGYLNMKA